MNYGDTQGDVVMGTKIITEMICSKISAFIGPEGSQCHIQATVAKSQNIPMISYVSTLIKQLIYKSWKTLF